MYYKTNYFSPIGNYTLVSDGENLVAISLIGQKYYEKEIPENTIEKNDLPLFEKIKNWLDRYFSGEKTEISELKLAPIGNEFRQSVWNILCEIPYGKLTTYGEIAKKIVAERNKKGGHHALSAQAVGGAVGHNPISIIIPCHRVIGTDGKLTGYASGIDRKIKLLELEGHKVFSDKIVNFKGDKNGNSSAVAFEN